MSSSSWVAARPFDFPYHRHFSPAETALLVIDVQVSFLAHDGYFAKKGYDPTPLRAVVRPIGLLAAAARSAGCHVVWTRQGYRPDLADLTPYERWRCERAGIRFQPGDDDVLVRRGPGHEIVPELKVAAGDTVIEKTANNAFYGTDLDLVLRSKGIKYLLFTGCTTDVCVHSTLREANDRKYQCLLVEDACASGDAQAHRAAVHQVTVEDGIFGVVADTAAVLQTLQAAGAPLRDCR